MVQKRGVVLTICLLALLIMSFSTAALDYYADVEISIDEAGTTTFSGITNHPALAAGKTEEYTSKKGSVWLLNISLDEPFSDFVFKVILPENAAISYVKAPSQVRIANLGSRLTITGTGKDEPFSVQVQYTLSSLPTKWGFSELLTWFGLPLLLILLGFILFRVGSKKEKQPEQRKDSGTGQSYNPDTLTERQKQILDIITGSKGLITQSMIEREIKIPKSSVSRNIDSLVRRGILRKERRGMSNILELVK